MHWPEQLKTTSQLPTRELITLLSEGNTVFK